MRVLYDDVIGPKDIVILSKGHGCLAQYALLVDKGVIPAEELDRFCREGAMLGGHPEHHIPGVHVSTGSLGHGLSLGIGFALADRSRRVFVIVGDGECNEGSVWEAALCAGKHKLSNLVVIMDWNHRQSYGDLDVVQPMDPLAEKWRSFGFSTRMVKGHCMHTLRRMFAYAPLAPKFARPLVVIANTVKGKGIPEVENAPLWHHRDTFTAEDGARLTAALDA